MSSTKQALRRLGLLASSSMVAVSLGAAAFTSASLVPTAVFAANECTPVGVDPSANGPTADSYTCSATTYANGITYNSAGDLTVTKSNTTNTTVTANGVNLLGSGADSVTWNSSAGNVTGGANTNGPLIDATTAGGDISVTTAALTAAQASITYGIRATSTGSGDIAVTSTGSLTANGAGTTSAILATTNGGDIAINLAGSAQATGASSTAAIAAYAGGGDISITTAPTAASSMVRGRLRGIVAETAGAGAITLNIGANIDATTAGGPLIETTAAGGVTTINFTGGIIGGVSQFGGIDLIYPDRVTIRAFSTSTSPTAAVTVHSSGALLFGAVDFSGVTSGGVTVNTTDTGLWRAGGDNVFTAGDDTINFGGFRPSIVGNALGEEGSMSFGAGNDTINISSSFEIGGHRFFGTTIGGATDLGATLDFGSGSDAINNSGTLGIEGPVMVAGLEAFNNEGTLSLGPISPIAVDPAIGDLGATDILTMPGATFTGSGLSRIIAAVHFGSGEQTSCATPTGAGDCLYIPEGATAGSTLVTLLNAGDAAAQGGFNSAGVTVIDVAGGATAASHFSLDPNSEGYRVDPILGEVIQRPGLFAYRLVYDPDTQRHAVVGLPRSEALEYVVLGSAAQSIWHMTTQAVTDRQTDLREAESGSVWTKVSGEYTSRDVESTIGAYADSFAFDNSYKLYAGSLMAGMDFITGHRGGYDYVLGGQIGYVGSTFDLKASPSSGQFTGATGGVYASVWDKAFFLDGTFNTNFLTLDYDAPGIGSKTTTWLRSVGAQLEGGRRFMLTEKIFAEPLATAAFMYTTFEEISLDGGEVQPDDAQSQRAALGLRVGADMFGGPLKVRYFVAGRAWNEFSGENEGVVFNPCADLPFAEDASGSFGEAQAGLSLFNDDQTIAGFLTSGVKFKDGYNAVDLDLGLRLRW